MQADPYLATFSLAARDPDTGELGVAVASKYLAVGAYCAWVQEDAGAVATQARTNISFGPDGLRLLASGMEPAAVSDTLLAADPGSAQRQLGIVSASGLSSTFTGGECVSWAGGVAGPGFAAQGNILTGPDVVDAMVGTLHERIDLAFPERLLAALQSAEEAGGDSRGRQSAALVVTGPYPRRVDLRVDDHPEPIGELNRLLNLWRRL